jgi:hypothetical protein
MKWTGHTSRVGERGVNRDFWWANQKEIEYYKDPDVDGIKILKWKIQK